MRDESIRRFIFNQNEVRTLIMEDLAQRGVSVQGESKIELHGHLIIFEIYDKTEERGDMQ